MKIIEKDFMVDGARCGTFCVYGEVEAELTITPETPKLTRVLPAPFFYEKRLFFYLIKRFEPGEHPYFDNGGFNIRGQDGEMRSYDLDQVIIHPQIVKHERTLAKMKYKAQKEANKREYKRIKIEKKANKHSRRGRPTMDPTEKAKRNSEIEAKSTGIKGKRGRPKSTNPPKILVSLPPSPAGRRGRPALSPEALAIKQMNKKEAHIRSGGKRGRPAKII